MNFNEYRLLGFTTLQNGLIAYYSKLEITDQQFIIILQLEAFDQRGDSFPSNEKIAANTNMNSNQVAAIIQQLIEQNLLLIEQTEDNTGRIGNKYNLAPLYQKIDDYLKNNVLIKDDKNPKKTKLTDSLNNNPLNELVRQFEMEFGRYLSPIEREEIASWLNQDHYAPQIIKLALREAVLSQAYSLKYVDRVLLNWQRHNLTTEDQVNQFLQRNR